MTSTPRRGLAQVVRLLKDALCGECDRDVAIISCEECHESYCKDCCEEVHSKGRRQYHTHFVKIQVCGECEGVAATKECAECKEYYCDKCCAEVHGKGKRAQHRLIKPLDKSQFRIINYDTSNAFGLNLDTLRVDRFRNDEGDLPEDLAPTDTLAVIAHMCRAQKKRFVDAEPCSFEISRTVPLRTIREEHQREDDAAEREQLWQNMHDELGPILDHVQVWRRAHQVIPQHSVFTGGNTILNEGPFGDPLPERAVKYLPKFQRGIFNDGWFLTAVSMLATHRPAFSNVFLSMEHRDVGMYVFQFWQNEGHSPGWKCVSVDDSVPCDAQFKPVLGRLIDPAEFWAIYLEKAYAKFLGGYACLHGGDTATAIEHFTGGTATIERWESDRYPVRDAFDLEHKEQLAAIWWKMVEGTRLGMPQACCKIDADAITPSTKEKKRPSMIWNDSACVVLQAVRVHVPGGQSHCLVKLRNNFGNIQWNGEWSDDSPLWTREMRELINYHHADDYITWMSINDFLQQFNTLCTITNMKAEGAPSTFFNRIPEVAQGDAAHAAHQFLITLNDPANPLSPERPQEKALEEVVQAVDLSKLKQEIQSDEEDDEEDEIPNGEEGETGSPDMASSTATKMSLSQRSTKAQDEGMYTVRTYLSQPEIIVAPGEFDREEVAKPVEGILFKVKGPELQQVVMTDTDYSNKANVAVGASTRGGSGFYSCAYEFPLAGRLDFSFTPMPNRKGDPDPHQLAGSMELKAGYYVLAIQAGECSEALDYVFALQGQDDYTNPTNYEMRVEYLGSCAEPATQNAYDGKKRRVRTQSQKAERMMKLI